MAFVDTKWLDNEQRHETKQEWRQRLLDRACDLRDVTDESLIGEREYILHVLNKSQGMRTRPTIFETHRAR